MKENIGSFAWICNIRVEITKVDSFGGVPHYGFVTVTGPSYSGWIPCAMLSGFELTA